ncbi:MarR family winged helix-turn-helix transcriptional regulator [Olivibacter domesticus]|uniref:DNA-binding transcriptional regulator, MarR family n=1 Tax=Olivibacter domesticus TaxID=407022 RepID=A0A1H7ZMG7_OLID1|nr:MarR family transcriptional regulator [Olivibacter domesticus]SEM59580.1 DNA-binding transcriptional regulator, MarR family [Olivibacter domesticus]
MNQDNTIDYYLKITWQSIANRYNYLASKHGITQATGYVLINIRKEGTPVTQIATLLGVKSTSLSRMLSGMEEQGFIYREADTRDKRSVRVFLTEEGQKKREIAKDIVREFNSYLDGYIKDTDREKLIDTLKRLNDLAVKYIPKEDLSK